MNLKLFHYRNRKTLDTLVKLKLCKLTVSQFYTLDKIISFVDNVTTRVGFFLSQLFERFGVEKTQENGAVRYDFSSLPPDLKNDLINEMSAFFDLEEKFPVEKKLRINVSKLESLGEITSEEFDILKNFIETEE